MKKSQISQIFVYILTLVVFSMILIYGYKAISNFISKGDEISLLQVRKELENSISKTSRDFGTVIREEISIPAKFSSICFVNTEKWNIANQQEICNPSNQQEYNALICDSWKSRAQFNLFLVEIKGGIESFFVGNVEVADPYYDCINSAQGRLTLRFEGIGGKTKVEEWQ